MCCLLVQANCSFDLLMWCCDADCAIRQNRVSCAPVTKLLLLLLLQVHLLDPEKPGQPRRLQTEGINFPGVWQQQALLDVDAIACNDVHAMLTTYGVEAARATILREVQVCDAWAAGGMQFKRMQLPCAGLQPSFFELAWTAVI